MWLPAMKTIQRHTKNLARRGFFVVKKAQDLLNSSLLHALLLQALYYYVPLLLIDRSRR
jgi:hypothetical protein